MINQIELKKILFCDICEKGSPVQYRVTNKNKKTWFFTCKDCWEDISKSEGYKYGGTRKANRRVRFN